MGRNDKGEKGCFDLCLEVIKDDNWLYNFVDEEIYKVLVNSMSF